MFLVYGQPVNAASPHWQGITTNESSSTWGGQLEEADWLCETIRFGEFVRQPSNALSTVSYALVGWLVLCLWVLDVTRQSSFESRFGNLPASVLLRKCSWSALLGASLFYMAVGAFLRHATASQTGKRLETSGYWTLLFGLTTCSLTRLVDAPRKLRNETRQILSATLTFVMIFATVGLDVWFGIRLELLGAPMIPEIVFGTLAGMSLLCMVLGVAINYASVESEVWWVWFGLGAFGIGYLLAKYDAEKMSCELQGRDSFYQSYALWHVLCSLSVLCFYLYLRSELWRRGDGAEFAPRIRPMLKLYRLWRSVVQCSRELVREEGDLQSPRVVGEEEEEGAEEKQEEDQPTPQRQRKQQRKTAGGGFNTIQLKFAQAVCGLGITGGILYVVFLAFSDPQ